MEENLYDTNKLIDAYKNSEDLRGYTTVLNLVEFPKALELDLEVIYPSRKDYDLALMISTQLLRAGKPIPAVDTVIAATCLNNKLKLATKDKHFLAIKEVRSDFEVEVE
ncbi:MAG: type II toxin-antitoxin system VapC family toxin [Archaeoglobaceae archaeon]